MDVDKGKDIFGAGAQFSLKKLVSVRFPIAKLLCSFKILSHGWNTCHGQVSWKWKRACFKSLDRHLTETEHWDLGQKWRTFHVGYRFRVSVCTHERGVAEAVGLSSRGKHGNEKQWHDKTERGQTGRQKNTGSPLFFRLHPTTDCVWCSSSAVFILGKISESFGSFVRQSKNKSDRVLSCMLAALVRFIAYYLLIIADETGRRIIGRIVGQQRTLYHPTPNREWDLLSSPAK